MSSLAEQYAAACCPGDLEAQQEFLQCELPPEKAMKDTVERFHRWVINQITEAAITSQDLLKPEYQDKIANGAHPLTGHCYVVCEAIAHELPGYKPYVVTHENDTHWFLKKDNVVIDPTYYQFETIVPYDKAKRCGFLTKEPSERAVKLLARALKWRKHGVSN